MEIITPTRVVFKGEATSLSAPGTVGGFQILHAHAPFLSELKTGILTVKKVSGEDIVYATSGGFVEVKDNKVVVLADTAEEKSEIDVARAKAAEDRSLRRLRSKDPAIDVERGKAACERAVNRLRLAQRV